MNLEVTYSVRLGGQQASGICLFAHVQDHRCVSHFLTIYMGTEDVNSGGLVDGDSFNGLFKNLNIIIFYLFLENSCVCIMYFDQTHPFFSLSNTFQVSISVVPSFYKLNVLSFFFKS